MFLRYTALFIFVASLLVTLGCTTQVISPDPQVSPGENVTSDQNTTTPAPIVMPETSQVCPGKWCYDPQLTTALKTHASALLAFKPKDSKEWCIDKYPNTLSFYLKLVASMAKYESGYKPDTSYTENFKDRRGNFVISVGLLQVSSESCAGYGMPYLQNPVLKEAKNNLECTARILNKWIPRDGVISQLGSCKTCHLGAGRYWSVMRVGSKHKREQIKALVCNP